MARRSEPHAVIRGGDMVLMTSISEAMPMTLLRTMAQGRASVARSVGGVPGVPGACGMRARDRYRDRPHYCAIRTSLPSSDVGDTNGSIGVIRSSAA
jgi:hypothetical protein